MTDDRPRTPRSIRPSEGRQFVSYGFGGRPNRFATGDTLKRKLFPRSQLTSGKRAAFRPISDPIDVNISVSGLTTIVEHLDAIAEFTGPLLWAGTIVAGNALVESMEKAVLEKDIWDTGDTFFSIHFDMFDASDGFWMDAGPQTFYSPFIEYGAQGRAPRPFVVPAGEEIAPAWTAFCVEVARLADAYAPISDPFGSDPQVKSLITRLRSHLYSEAKALGDIAVLGGRGIIHPLRTGMYGLARGLGDLQSLMRGTVAARITRRLRGKVTGRLIGVGSASVTTTVDQSALIGGPAGKRIYTRIAGRHSRFMVQGGGVHI